MTRARRMRDLAGPLRRLAGPGVYPPELAWMLLLPVRRLIISPTALATQLGLSPADRVLEVGAGPGYFSASVARRLPHGHLELVDVQPEMLARARARLGRAGVRNVGFTVADAASLPFGDATFDVAFLVTVLGEIADRPVALRELRRALRPGGRLSITEQKGDPGRASPTALRLEIEQVGFDLLAVRSRRLSFTADFRRQAP